MNLLRLSASVLHLALAGITMLLRTDFSDYPSSGLAECSGFFVQLHRVHQTPRPDELGFLVAPGAVTRVAAKLVSYSSANDDLIAASNNKQL